jgi:HD-GYP domain-containing protein (c-di-GMP phosphodiesterase class II)
MNKRTFVYVWSIAVAAAAAMVVLVRATGRVDVSFFSGAILMASIGVISTLFSYSVQGGQTANVSFLPNLTAIILYPSWATVAVVGASNLLLSRRSRLRTMFNVAQYLLAGSVASLLYMGLGGEALKAGDPFRPLAHTSAVIGFLLTNSVCVAAAVALNDEKGFWPTWIEGNRTNILLDLISVPFVYGFARAYIDWGVWGGGALLTLIVGVRTTYQSLHRLQNTNKDLLDLFVQTVEFRDPYTSGHSQRVQRSSRIIAELLGISEKEKERIATAALLHDVGKIHQVFGPILSKTGRLTPEERAVMELHPIKSAELVAKIRDLQDLVPAVRGHHERWDGAGYPDQLAGENIPLGARIITIADTIDAMVTDRPYRKALGEAEVREELAKHRGTQFDPTICDMLLASPHFARIFDPSDSGQAIRLTGMFPAVRKRIRTPAAA